MFVDITTPKKPLEAEKLFRACWRKGEEITPEICEEVLRSTNFKTCIKRMLECVERLPEEKQAAFKEVVLATFTNREQPVEVSEIGKRLAVSNGYMAELRDVLGKKDYTQDYIESSPEIKKQEAGPVKVFDDESYMVYDFKEDKRAKFTASRVSLCGAKNLPPLSDFSDCEEICLRDCDLGEVAKLTFGSMARIDFSGAKNLPPVLDFSDCDEVGVWKCDCRSVGAFHFKEGAKVHLHYAKNLPRVLDFSMCDEVGLWYSNLSGVEEIKLKPGATVDWRGVENLPRTTDVSNCDAVNMFDCDLSGINDLKFKDGATVYLTGGCVLPKKTDVAYCAKVELYLSDVSRVEELRFYNRWQKEQSKVDIPKDWGGKMLLIDEKDLLYPKGVAIEEKMLLKTMWNKIKGFGR